MNIVEVKDISKKIVIEFSYDEWFNIIYLLEKEKRENISCSIIDMQGFTRRKK